MPQVVFFVTNTLPCTRGTNVPNFTDVRKVPRAAAKPVRAAALMHALVGWSHRQRCRTPHKAPGYRKWSGNGDRAG